jgi:hypothetical protein
MVTPRQQTQPGIGTSTPVATAVPSETILETQWISSTGTAVSVRQSAASPPMTPMECISLTTKATGYITGSPTARKRGFSVWRGKFNIVLVHMNGNWLHVRGNFAGGDFACGRFEVWIWSCRMAQRTFLICFIFRGSVVSIDLLPKRHMSSFESIFG